MDCPRIVIAGTHSGVGKTSLTLAFVAALRKRGYRVQTFKAGPDFLDPSYLAVASGRPCYNLDGWMTDRNYVCRLFARAAKNADIAVIEGVMGLFDGADPADSTGSTAEIAAWLNAPALLIVDAHGASRSLAATVKGYADFEKDVHVACVLANRSGSERHKTWLADSLAAAQLPPLIGAIPRDVLSGLPSRHLGLVSADAGNVSQALLDNYADAVERYASVDEFLHIARSAPPLNINTFSNNRDMSPACEGGNQRVTIGVARDAAFHFYYQDMFDELAALGCDLYFFSPVADNRLPGDLDALYIGGGYPEEQAAELSANKAMLADIREFATSGRSIYAECGGLMYLCSALKKQDGVAFPMADVIPATTRMLDKKKSLGYAEVTLNSNSLWGLKGTKLRGHEFHYSELTSDPAIADGWNAVYEVKRRRMPETAGEGFQKGRILASYVHLHLAARPEALRHFISLCRANT